MRTDTSPYSYIRTKFVAFAAAVSVMTAGPLLFLHAGKGRAPITIKNYAAEAVTITVYGAESDVIREEEQKTDFILLRAEGVKLPDTVTVYDTESGEVLALDTEEYIVGVVAAEMPASFEAEALRAQAVAARSYMLYKLLHSPAAHKGGAALCADSSCCEAYISYDKACRLWSKAAADEAFSKIRSALEPTRGVIMTCGDGSKGVVCAVFHSSSSGRTESSANVWGGDYSYLRSVDTPENNEAVTSAFTESEFFALLRGAGYDCENSGIEITPNDTGRVGFLVIGKNKIPGAEVRRIFGLRSTDFTLQYSDGAYIFTCRGYGHGIGLSQYGADILAKEGYTYDEILLHYYSGVKLRRAD